MYSHLPASRRSIPHAARFRCRRPGGPAVPVNPVAPGILYRAPGTGADTRHGTAFAGLPTGWPEARLYGGVMVDRVSPRQFLESDGVHDWRLVWGGGWACAHFPVPSYELGVALVAAIGKLAAAASRRPDIDVRPDGVTVRLFSGEHEGLSSQDVEMARQVSAAARELGLTADPAVPQHVQVAIDAMDIAKVVPFWGAVLGYTQVGDADVIDSLRRGPSFWFQQMDAPRTQRGRIHIDLYIPADQAQPRIDAALAAGGRIVDDSHAPGWWTLADPEGNEVDVAIWLSD
jgi:4a-hydroxytetrahydrobiopterin dehydratase